MIEWTRYQCVDMARSASRGKFQQGFCGFTRKVVRQHQQGVFVGHLDVAEPLGRHAIGEQFIVGLVREQGGLRPHRDHLMYVDWNDDLLDRLSNLHELRSPRLGMRLHLAPLGPVVGPVVPVHVAEQQTARTLVDDESDVRVHAH